MEIIARLENGVAIRYEGMNLLRTKENSWKHLLSGGLVGYITGPLLEKSVFTDKLDRIYAEL